MTLAVLPAMAQQGTGIAISPLTFEITANPGDTITNAVRIYNPNPDPLNVSLHVEDIAPSGETGQALIEAAESTGYSIAAWTLIDRAELTIPSGIAELTNFTVRIPANAEPGGHYGAITAEARGGAVAGSGAAIAQKVAALLLISVAGDVNEALSLVDFTGPSGVVTDASLITLLSRFENSGSVHLKPRGFVTVTDMFGRELAQVALDQRNVLPNTKRIIETDWQPEGFVFGRVNAQLTAIYGSANEPLAASVEFWVLPMNVFGPVLGGLAVLLVFVVVLRRRLGLAFSILVRGQRPSA